MVDFSKLQKLEHGVYVKRGKFFGTRLIFPITNEDGTVNKFNLFTGGSWSNLVMIALITLLLIGSVFAYRHDMKSCSDMLDYVSKNPCEWCNMVREVQQQNNIIDTSQLQLEWQNLFNQTKNSSG